MKAFWAFFSVSMLVFGNFVIGLVNNRELRELRKAQEEDRIEISIQKDLLRRFKNPHEIAKSQADFQRLLNMYRNPTVTDAQIEAFIKEIESK